MSKRVLAFGLCMLLICSAFIHMSLGYDVKSTLFLNEPESTQSSNDEIDWWPMFHHDLNHSGYSTSDGPEKNNVLWAYQVINDVLDQSSPAVIDNKVYFGGGSKYFYCLNSDTGKEIWKTAIPFGIGTSSPAVENGRVYFGAGYRNGGIYCLNATTGEIIWRYQTPGDTRVFASPSIYDGKVFIGAPDPSPGCMYCLDAVTGEEIWIYQNIISPGSAAVYNDKVYFGTRDLIYCLNSDTGKLFWKYPINGVYKISQVSIYDGKLYARGGDGLYCLNLDGDFIWRYLTEKSIYSTPCLANGYVFFDSFDDYLSCDYICCLDAISGEKIWSFNIKASQSYCSPSYADGKLYFCSGGFDPKIYCLDGNSGEKIWDFSTGDDVDSSPAIVDGKVYVGTERELLCLGGESDNRPPITPNNIMGPRNGTVLNSYTYNASTFDPDGDQLYYKWDWGAYHSDWMGPYDSNETVEIEIDFREECYLIKLIVKDTHHARSGWGTFEVNIPRDRRTYYNLFSRFIDKFPILKGVILRLIR